MSYTRHEWVSKETITADLLNNMEQGIQDANDNIPDVSNYVTTDTLSNYVVKDITSDTGTARVWNESSGGGSMYIHTDGSKSAICVNNGGADSISAQIYALNDTTKHGTRINIFNKGAYYIPNKSSSDVDYDIDDPDQEIAVKGDLTDLLNRIAALEAKVEALESAGS